MQTLVGRRRRKGRRLRSKHLWMGGEERVREERVGEERVGEVLGMTWNMRLPMALV